MVISKYAESSWHFGLSSHVKTSMKILGTKGSSSIAFLPIVVGIRLPSVANACSDTALFNDEVKRACIVLGVDTCLMFSSFVDRLCRVERHVSFVSSSVSFESRILRRKGRMWDDERGNGVFAREEIENRR